MQRLRNFGRRTTIIKELIPIAVMLVLFALDLILKAIIVSANTTGELPKNVIEGFFRIIYVENPGAAFSFLSDKPWAQTVFLIITPMAVILFGVAYRFLRKRSWVVRYGFVLIIAGTLGNYIDRIFNGYVVDFLSFTFGSLGTFATFNFADACLTVGVILVIIHFLFIDKDALFKFDNAKNKNTETDGK